MLTSKLMVLVLNHSSKLQSLQMMGRYLVVEWQPLLVLETLHPCHGLELLIMISLVLERL